MNTAFNNKISRSFRTALDYVLVSLLAYSGAYYLTGTLHITSTFAPIGALWAVIVGVSVMQENWISTVEKARFQVLGGLVGAILSLVYLKFLPFNPIGMVLLMGIAVFLCQSLGRPDYSTPAALTVAVILFFSHINPELSPIMNAGLRFSEVIIGSAIAILVVRLLPHAKDQTV
ncbi:MAG: FUSC family protein [Methanoregula sp.]|nr:FUSC family protein [Methanoregula sp.]